MGAVTHQLAIADIAGIPAIGNRGAKHEVLVSLSRGRVQAAKCGCDVIGVVVGALAVVGPAGCEVVMSIPCAIHIQLVDAER